VREDQVWKDVVREEGRDGGMYGEREGKSRRSGDSGGKAKGGKEGEEDEGRKGGEVNRLRNDPDIAV